MTHTFWTFFLDYQKELISFGLTLLASLVLFFFRARVKIIWGRANNNFFRLEPVPPPAPPQGQPSPTPATQSNPAPQTPNPITLYSEKHYIKNASRAPAMNVDVIFSGKPDSISIWQNRKFVEVRLPNGNYIITIPSMAPYELVIIDSLWITPNHGQVDGVRCADALGKQVEFWVNRNFGRTFNIVVGLLMLLGAYYAIVLLLKILIG